MTCGPLIATSPTIPEPTSFPVGSSRDTNVEGTGRPTPGALMSPVGGLQVTVPAASDRPYPSQIVLPVRSFQRRAVSGLVGMPPAVVTLRWLQSTLSNSGCAINPLKSVLRPGNIWTL